LLLSHLFKLAELFREKLLDDPKLLWMFCLLNTLKYAAIITTCTCGLVSPDLWKISYIACLNSQHLGTATKSQM
jgi:hypothetical protein